MTAKTPWFTVDKAGLAKIVAGRGMGPIALPEIFA